MQSSTVPVPTAYMHDPPIPEIGYGAIGWSDLKSERSGVMWAVAPVSRKKGHSVVIGTREAEKATGSTGIWFRSMALLWLFQSTDA